VARRAPRLLLVPGDVALAFTPGRGWHLLEGPVGWVEEQVRLSDEMDRRAGLLRLVPPLDELAERRTACRPGRGPCRRRHEHASERRTAG
jgi:hypothetical protein